MTDQEFWNLIDIIDRDALDQEDEDAAVEPLILALTERTEAELTAFEELLAQKLYALDGEIYARNAGVSGDSSDGFLYMRCYVVARGKEYYESILQSPQKMPKSIEQWCEGLLYVHRQAWSELTGKDESDWDFESGVSYETGSNIALWPGSSA